MAFSARDTEFAGKLQWRHLPTPGIPIPPAQPRLRAVEPEVMLFDEVTSALNPELAKSLLGLDARVRKARPVAAA